MKIKELKIGEYFTIKPTFAENMTEQTKNTVVENSLTFPIADYLMETKKCIQISHFDGGTNTWNIHRMKYMNAR